MKRMLLISISLCLASSSCKNKEEVEKKQVDEKAKDEADPTDLTREPGRCLKARDIQLKAMREFGRPIHGNLDTDEQRKANAEADQTFEAFLKRVEEEFVPVCEGLGPDKVLACTSATLNRLQGGGEAVPKECDSIMTEMSKKIPPPKSNFTGVKFEDAESTARELQP